MLIYLIILPKYYENWVFYMALIKYPECGREISDESDKCIHCGYPLKTKTLCKINGIEQDLSFILDKSIEETKKLKYLENLQIVD